MSTDLEKSIEKHNDQLFDHIFSLDYSDISYQSGNILDLSNLRGFPTTISSTIKHQYLYGYRTVIQEYAKLHPGKAPQPINYSPGFCIQLLSLVLDENVGEAHPQIAFAVPALKLFCQLFPQAINEIDTMLEVTPFVFLLSQTPREVTPVHLDILRLFMSYRAIPCTLHPNTSSIANGSFSVVSNYSDAVGPPPDDDNDVYEDKPPQNLYTQMRKSPYHVGAISPNNPLSLSLVSLSDLIPPKHYIPDTPSTVYLWPPTVVWFQTHSRHWSELVKQFLHELISYEKTFIPNVLSYTDFTIGDTVKNITPDATRDLTIPSSHCVDIDFGQSGTISIQPYILSLYTNPVKLHRESIWHFIASYFHFYLVPSQLFLPTQPSLPNSFILKFLIDHYNALWHVDASSSLQYHIDNCRVHYQQLALPQLHQYPSTLSVTSHGFNILLKILRYPKQYTITSVELLQLIFSSPRFHSAFYLYRFNPMDHQYYALSDYLDYIKDHLTTHTTFTPRACPLLLIPYINQDSNSTCFLSSTLSPSIHLFPTSSLPSSSSLALAERRGEMFKALLIQSYANLPLYRAIQAMVGNPFSDVLTNEYQDPLQPRFIFDKQYASPFPSKQSSHYSSSRKFNPYFQQMVEMLLFYSLHPCQREGITDPSPSPSVTTPPAPAPLEDNDTNHTRNAPTFLSEYIQSLPFENAINTLILPFKTLLPRRPALLATYSIGHDVPTSSSESNHSKPLSSPHTSLSFPPEFASTLVSTFTSERSLSVFFELAEKLHAAHGVCTQTSTTTTGRRLGDRATSHYERIGSSVLHAPTSSYCNNTSSITNRSDYYGGQCHERITSSTAVAMDRTLSSPNSSFMLPPSSSLSSSSSSCLPQSPPQPIITQYSSYPSLQIYLHQHASLILYAAVMESTHCNIELVAYLIYHYHALLSCYYHTYYQDYNRNIISQLFNAFHLPIHQRVMLITMLLRNGLDKKNLLYLSSFSIQDRSYLHSTYSPQMKTIKNVIMGLYHVRTPLFSGIRSIFSKKKNAGGNANSSTIYTLKDPIPHEIFMDTPISSLFACKLSSLPPRSVGESNDRGMLPILVLNCGLSDMMVSHFIAVAYTTDELSQMPSYIQHQNYHFGHLLNSSILSSHSPIPFMEYDNNLRYPCMYQLTSLFIHSVYARQTLSALYPPTGKGILSTPDCIIASRFIAVQSQKVFDVLQSIPNTQYNIVIPVPQHARFNIEHLTVNQCYQVFLPQLQLQNYYTSLITSLLFFHYDLIMKFTISKPKAFFELIHHHFFSETTSHYTFSRGALSLQTHADALSFFKVLHDNIFSTNKGGEQVQRDGVLSSDVKYHCYQRDHSLQLFFYDEAFIQKTLTPNTPRALVTRSSAIPVTVFDRVHQILHLVGMTTVYPESQREGQLVLVSDMQSGGVSLPLPSSSSLTTQQQEQAQTQQQQQQQHPLTSPVLLPPYKENQFQYRLTPKFYLGTACSRNVYASLYSSFIQYINQPKLTKAKIDADALFQPSIPFSIEILSIIYQVLQASTDIVGDKDNNDINGGSCSDIYAASSKRVKRIVYPYARALSPMYNELLPYIYNNYPSLAHAITSCPYCRFTVSSTYCLRDSQFADHGDDARSTPCHRGNTYFSNAIQTHRMSRSISSSPISHAISSPSDAYSAPTLGDQPTATTKASTGSQSPPPAVLSSPATSAPIPATKTSHKPSTMVHTSSPHSSPQPVIQTPPPAMASVNYDSDMFPPTNPGNIGLTFLTRVKTHIYPPMYSLLGCQGVPLSPIWLQVFDMLKMPFTNMIVQSIFLTRSPLVLFLSSISVPHFHFHYAVLEHFLRPVGRFSSVINMVLETADLVNYVLTHDRLITARCSDNLELFSEIRRNEKDAYNALHRDNAAGGDGGDVPSTAPTIGITEPSLPPGSAAHDDPIQDNTHHHHHSGYHSSSNGGDTLLQRLTDIPELVYDDLSSLFKSLKYPHFVTSDEIAQVLLASPRSSLHGTPDQHQAYIDLNKHERDIRQTEGLSLGDGGGLPSDCLTTEEHQGGQASQHRPVQPQRHLPPRPIRPFTQSYQTSFVNVRPDDYPRVFPLVQPIAKHYSFSTIDAMYALFKPIRHPSPPPTSMSNNSFLSYPTQQTDDANHCEYHIPSYTKYISSFARYDFRMRKFYMSPITEKFLKQTHFYTPNAITVLIVYRLLVHIEQIAYPDIAERVEHLNRWRPSSSFTDITALDGYKYSLSSPSGFLIHAFLTYITTYAHPNRHAVEMLRLLIESGLSARNDPSSRYMSPILVYLSSVRHPLLISSDEHHASFYKVFRLLLDNYTTPPPTPAAACATFSVPKQSASTNASPDPSSSSSSPQLSSYHSFYDLFYCDYSVISKRGSGIPDEQSLSYNYTGRITIPRQSYYDLFQSSYVARLIKPSDANLMPTSLLISSFGKELPESETPLHTTLHSADHIPALWFDPFTRLTQHEHASGFRAHSLLSAFLFGLVEFTPQQLMTFYTILSTSHVQIDYSLLPVKIYHVLSDDDDDARHVLSMLNTYRSTTLERETPGMFLLPLIHPKPTDSTRSDYNIVGEPSDASVLPDSEHGSDDIHHHDEYSGDHDGAGSVDGDNHDDEPYEDFFDNLESYDTHNGTDEDVILQSVQTKLYCPHPLTQTLYKSQLWSLKAMTMIPTSDDDFHLWAGVHRIPSMHDDPDNMLIMCGKYNIAEFSNYPFITAVANALEGSLVFGFNPANYRNPNHRFNAEKHHRALSKCFYWKDDRYCKSNPSNSGSPGCINASTEDIDSSSAYHSVNSSLNAHPTQESTSPVHHLFDPDCVTSPIPHTRSATAFVKPILAHLLNTLYLYNQLDYFPTNCRYISALDAMLHHPIPSIRAWFEEPFGIHTDKHAPSVDNPVARQYDLQHILSDNDLSVVFAFYDNLKTEIPLKLIDSVQNVVEIPMAYQNIAPATLSNVIYQVEVPAIPPPSDPSRPHSIQTLYGTMYDGTIGIFWYLINCCQPSVDDIMHLLYEYEGVISVHWLNHRRQSLLMHAILRRWDSRLLLFLINTIGITNVIQHRDDYGLSAFDYMRICNTYFDAPDAFQTLAEHHTV